jgi:hypothetical protein
LIKGDELVAGPFHPSFRELVLTEIWHDLLKPLFKEESQKIEITVAPDQLNYAIGYLSKNKLLLLQTFHEVKFLTDPQLIERQMKTTFG